MSRGDYVLPILICLVCSNAVMIASGSEQLISGGTEPPGSSATQALAPGVPAQPELIQLRSDVPCGPGCIAIICRIMGLEIENDHLAALADARGESSFESIQGYLETRGLYCRAIETTPSMMQRSPYVSILQLRSRSPAGQDAVFHFIVFSGGSGNGQDYCFDPLASSGLGRTPMDRLADKWTGRALLVSQTPITLDWNDQPASATSAAGVSSASLYGALAGTLGGVALSAIAGRSVSRRRKPL